MDFLDIISEAVNKKAGPVDRLLIMSLSFVIHYTLYGTVKLRIPDYLYGKELSPVQLAKLTKTNPAALFRLLRTLTTIGIVEERDHQKFRLTDLGKLLAEDPPDSLRGWVEFTGEPFYTHCWEKLAESVRTGEPVWEKVHGTSMFEYFASNKHASNIFDSAMTNLSNIEAPAIIEAYDFGPYKTIVDIGGGQGYLLAKILMKYSHINGILFDFPYVIARARAYFARQGLKSRSKVIGGDFFKTVPRGGDAYLLKFILHDWDDQHCVKILRNCRKAMKPTAKLLVVEPVMPESKTPHLGTFDDLEMLVILGGRDRTRREHEKLLRESGFAVTREIKTKSYHSILEAVPV
ncbi:MAG: hypothetical protein JRN68_05745 [Nitrososphaerota archaeon]|jgi:hypothetical protein|nr:hypothetical protein [Nitrososphaerota archaeon]